MIDPIFSEPRLAEIYDAFESDRRDLDAYADIVAEFGAGSVLDIGCGTGTFSCLLAGRGIGVIGVDPAAASLNVARAKREADLVRWIRTDATALPALQVDMAVMTGNVAQVFCTDDDWAATLRGIHHAVKPGGRFVFETRDPRRQAWREWDRERTYKSKNVPGAGVVQTWCDLIEVSDEFVSFRWTYLFDTDGARLVSDSTLRFRTPAQIERSLRDNGFTVEDVRDAPDRPGREFVFVAVARDLSGT